MIKISLSIEPGTEVLWRTRNKEGKNVSFVVLPFELAKYMSKVIKDGTECACISDSVIAADGDGLRLYADSGDNAGIYVYPVPGEVNVEGEILDLSKDGVFAHCRLRDMLSDNGGVCTAEKVKASTADKYVPAIDESAWDSASE